MLKSKVTVSKPAAGERWNADSTLSLATKAVMNILDTPIDSA
jgi:hypothetical protein